LALEFLIINVLNKYCVIREASFLVVIAVLRIRRIRMFLGLMDPDTYPLVRGTDPDLDPNPDPSIIKQKWYEKP
jgi:hypothetical protein